MDALIVVVVATLFAYGVMWLFERAPLTTADLAVGALAGLSGLALGGGLAGALLMACAIALALQTLRRPGMRQVK